MVSASVVGISGDQTCVDPETSGGQRTRIGYRGLGVEVGLVVESFGAVN